MHLIAQSDKAAESSTYMSVDLIFFIALGVSITLTVLLWRLGVIRRMVNVQNERQKRFRLYGIRNNWRYIEWGTGRNAALSFAGAIWTITFGIVFFGLVLWS